jgi:hypothetical protein
VLFSSSVSRFSFAVRSFKVCARVGSATAALTGLLLSGCASTPSPSASEPNASVLALAAPFSAEQGWQRVNLPGKRATLYTSQKEDGRPAVYAKADRSASLLRKKVSIEPQDLSALRFSWKARALLEGADMAVRETEDAKVRVILSFEGDRSKFSLKNQMLSELALSLTGEEMPYATLMYVWSNKQPVGSTITNPRTDRIRKLVVESGKERLGQWLAYERDIAADFKAAFGEAPGKLTGIAIMTDADNLQTQTSAWYGAIELGQLPAVALK